MHDLFGAEMMDVFDLDNGDVDLRILEPPKKKPQEQTGQSAADAEKQTEQKAAASDGTVTAKNGGEQTEQHAKENFETK